MSTDFLSDLSANFKEFWRSRTESRGCCFGAQWPGLHNPVAWLTRDSKGEKPKVTIRGPFLWHLLAIVPFLILHSYQRLPAANGSHNAPIPFGPLLVVSDFAGRNVDSEFLAGDEFAKFRYRRWKVKLLAFEELAVFDSAKYQEPVSIRFDGRDCLLKSCLIIFVVLEFADPADRIGSDGKSDAGE